MGDRLLLRTVTVASHQTHNSLSDAKMGLSFFSSFLIAQCDPVFLSCDRDGMRTTLTFSAQPLTNTPNYCRVLPSIVYSRVGTRDNAPEARVLHTRSRCSLSLAACVIDLCQ